MVPAAGRVENDARRQNAIGRGATLHAKTQRDGAYNSI
jgi:hypothetical protein